MGDLPKWAADTLAQMPVVGVGVLVAYAAVKWAERRHDAELKRQQASHPDQLRLLEQRYKAIVRAKNELIRELRRDPGSRGRGGKP